MNEQPAVTIPSPTAENVNPVEPVTTDEVETPTLLGADPEVSPEAGDDKKPDVEPAVVPEGKYEIKLPEGITLDAATLDVFSPIFKDLGISNDGAQKLVDAYIPLVTSQVDKARQESLVEYKGIVDGWKSETMKELGAAAKQELAACGKALQKFGSKELREVLQETGLGNHKELVRFMAKIGKTISEDSVVDPGQSHQIGSFDLKKMYPSMTQ
jgi:hypothetical protein